jgi:hypothetical protein
VVNRSDELTSVRQAAAVCNVTPPVVRRWLSLGLITPPPRTLQQLHQVRELTDPHDRRRGPQTAYCTLTRWLEGWDCDRCREAQNDARARFRRRAQTRLPLEVRKQFLDAIYAGAETTSSMETNAVLCWLCLPRAPRPSAHPDG